MSYSLDDLPTYNVTINLNLPEIKPLKEPVQKSKFRRTIARSSMEPWIRNNFERWEKHLFILSTAFIDAIWKPFEEIEDFLFSLLTLQDAEQIDFVSENWKQVFFENSENLVTGKMSENYSLSLEAAKNARQFLHKT